MFNYNKTNSAQVPATDAGSKRLNRERPNFHVCSFTAFMLESACIPFSLENHHALHPSRFRLLALAVPCRVGLR